jgi:hypothetical protein
MMKNDLDMEQWRACDINVESLWLIGERNKSEVIPLAFYVLDAIFYF